MPIRSGRCSAPNAPRCCRLNVPHFVSPSDGSEIGDAGGHLGTDRGDPRPRSRARPRAPSFDDAGDRLAGRGHPGRIPARLAKAGIGCGRRRAATRRHSRRRGRRAGGRNLRRGSRPDRRGDRRLRHSPRAGRGLDRARLAGRLRSLPARLPGSRPLQRRLRHRRSFSPRTRGDRERALGATLRSPRSRACART